MEHKKRKKKDNNRGINYLGIDYGKSKIGLAFAPKGLLATGFLILPNDKNFLVNLRKIIQENDIRGIVIGMPLSMNGQISLSTKNALRFIAGMRKNFSGQKVFTYDERLSSKEAKRNLPSSKFDDAEAARIILQGFLDKQKHKKENIPYLL